MVFLGTNFHFFFVVQNKFGVRPLRDSPNEMMAALYLQVSIVSQALIFVTRSRSWSFIERPGALLMGAFMIAQLVSIVFISSFTYTYKHHKITYGTLAWLWAHKQQDPNPCECLCTFFSWFLCS